MRRRVFAALVLAFALGSSGGGAGSIQETESESAPQTAETSALEIVAVEVSPAEPGDETLCRLRVRIRNRGELPAYALGFEVRLEGGALPVYEKQLFYQRLPPGEVTEVRLFNFWTTETGRPRPADGVLDVEVVLREASWLEVTQEEEEGSDEPVEVWTPAGGVEGLPVSGALAVTLR